MSHDDDHDDHDHDDHDHDDDDHDHGVAKPGTTEADDTLGGYLDVHKRPPAFEGSDGQPYTVSIEVEKTADLRAPWVAYLVFPRWAETGLGVVGHVETPVEWKGTARDQIVELVGRTPLLEVKRLLDEAIERRRQES